MTFRRAWGGDEWQAFALKLVQLRHQAQNVQTVPDKVKGDAGIEYFSTDGCLYQSYAPEESTDLQKAASAMKSKARIDINKLNKNRDTIGGILCNLKIKRWILLCPFLDDKAVVAYVRQCGERIKSSAIPFITADFETLIQSQEDFLSELEQLRLFSVGPPLVVADLTPEAIRVAEGGEIGQRLAAKLSRAFNGTTTPDDLEKRQRGYIRAHLRRENALEALKRDHPALWERAFQCMAAEEERLVALGTTSAVPAQQLTNSVDRIETSLRQDLSGLSGSTITQIALGTVSDWLVRCPLDFPENGSS